MLVVVVTRMVSLKPEDEVVEELLPTSAMDPAMAAATAIPINTKSFFRNNP
jgi:hypothetical protein